jgi:hypothetical protein
MGEVDARDGVDLGRGTLARDARRALVVVHTAE